ncbi:recombinase family protein [Candidatus Woesearchaeota archaeon]|nr:recombinase family protein [Candidatus Woesearchaeota archaeon]
MTLSAQNNEADIPKAAVYVRVSTEDQVQHGFSLAAQEESLKNYARVMGYTIHRVYKDEGKSAKDMKHRPALQELLSDAEKKMFSAIFTYKLDRFSRSLKDLILTIDKLKEWNIDFISLQDKIETASASGKLMFHIISAFAEFERNIIGERTTFGMARKNKEGGAVTKPPFGYQMIDKKLVVVEEDAEQVREMYALFLQGMSLNKLAKEGGFSVNGIKKILQNRTYLGEVTFARESSKGVHQPIVEKGLFDAVQERVKK